MKTQKQLKKDSFEIGSIAIVVSLITVLVVGFIVR